MVKVKFAQPSQSCEHDSRKVLQSPLVFLHILRHLQTYSKLQILLSTYKFYNVIVKKTYPASKIV